MKCPECKSEDIDVDDEDDEASGYGIVYVCLCRACGNRWKVDGPDYE